MRYFSVQYPLGLCYPETSCGPSPSFAACAIPSGILKIARTATALPPDAAVPVNGYAESL